MKILYKNIILILAVLFLLAAVLFKSNSFNKLYVDKEVKKFQNTIVNKENFRDQLIAYTVEKLKDKNLSEFKEDNYSYYKNLFNESGITILIYKKDSLAFWTDNIFPIGNFFFDSDLDKKIIKLQNVWLDVNSKKIENIKVVGLVSIKTEYGSENKFLKTGFAKQFNLPSYFEIRKEKSEESYNIVNNNNEHLCSLYVHEKDKFDCYCLNLSFALFFVSFVLLLLYLQVFTCRLKNIKQRQIFFILVSAILILFRFFSLKLNLFEIFYSFGLFSPKVYASSFLFPSLGDLLINSILIFFIFYGFYVNFFKSRELKTTKKIKYLISIILIFIIEICCVAAVLLLKSLICNSSISLQAYKILSLTGYSLISFIIIGLLFFSIALLIDKAALIIRQILTLKQVCFLFILSFVILFSFCVFSHSTQIISQYLLSIIFFCVITSFVFYVRFKGKFNYLTYVILVFLFSLFITFFIRTQIVAKETEQEKLLAENLARERDPIAELMLVDIEKNIKKDKQLINKLNYSVFNYDSIYDYIKAKYFKGYFDKYDFQLTICSPYDSVYIQQPDNELDYCYGFFKFLTDSMGVNLPKSDFYFLDNISGRISYLGAIKYKSDLNSESTAFISLDSKQYSKALGYPELLLDDKISIAPKNNYSYAIYKYNKLITRSGNFPYSLDRRVYTNSDDKNIFCKFEKYHHLIHNLDTQTSIIISKPLVRFIDELISFSYFFIFYYIIVTIILLLNKTLKIDFNLNIKNKIKISILSILIFSLLVIGGVTVYYSIRQFKQNQNKNISEKIQSVLVELEHKLGYENNLSDVSPEYLNSLLSKFSNVFYTDINLYDINGRLLATSRNEIFDIGLLGRRINFDAYKRLIINKNAQFINYEKIGKLKYISAYVPLTNDNNKLLAYLHLPYFSKQSTLENDVSTIIVAIINIYALLVILSLIIAVFISNNVTKPLQLIQDKIREIDLRKKNEYLEYDIDDEIGSLVKEYNRMVDELEQSAKQLAKSERETAWREMAKQIAHEINNPLTPMKLSVQFLQRSWKDKDPEFPAKLKKVSQTIVEQIDTLSAIAAEFSNFAKIPKTKNDNVDILKVAKSSMNLYGDIKNIKLNADFNNIEKLTVFADKEKLMRVFNNLIKNAIQSIDNNKQGIIDIDISTDNKNMLIKIADNGKGIDEEMKQKLFEPNFTTKTSGMGLGLSIVKNIVNEINGSIWFDSELGKGTNFFVKLPVC
ncbi:MAG: GHKL domain-containing protein [Bacteroidetes bacterium]|nr:GHKL domain-containing protein [Bacteroidota bacterium]